MFPTFPGNYRNKWSKCECFQATIQLPEVSFYEHDCSYHSKKPDFTKLHGIAPMEASSNKEILQTFLGMVNYVNSFSPHLAHFMEPLHKLTHRHDGYECEFHKLISSNQTGNFSSTYVAMHIPKGGYMCYHINHEKSRGHGNPEGKTSML